MDINKNIEIKDFVSAIRFMLDCGFEYGWDCYGEDACGIGWTSRDLKASAQIVYDANNGKVYEASVWDDDAPSIPRWIRKGYKAKHDREARSRNVNPDIAIDKKKYEDMGADEVMAAIKRLIRKKTK